MGILDKAIANSAPFMPKPFVQRIARGYTAGEDATDAVRVVRDLRKQGCLATVSVLGEHATTEQQTLKRLEEYKRGVDALEEQGLDYQVAVKLTDIGFLIDEELCRTNLETLLLYAKERGRFLAIDMEESPLVSATLDMVLDMHDRHGNTGAVVQAYLRRTLKDVQRLVEAGIPTWLVKGVYVEGMKVAYQNYDVVRQNYVLLLEELLRGGIHARIATHDEYLIWHTLRLVHQLGLTKDQYEFQMIMGVQEELRKILVEAGHRVRVTVLFGKDSYEYTGGKRSSLQPGNSIRTWDPRLRTGSVLSERTRPTDLLLHYVRCCHNAGAGSLPALETGDSRRCYRFDPRWRSGHHPVGISGATAGVEQCAHRTATLYSNTDRRQFAYGRQP